MAEHKPVAWPRRVLIVQEGVGEGNCSIYDADTHEQMMFIFKIVIERGQSVACITGSKYDPPRLTLDVLGPWVTDKQELPPDPDALAEDCQGVVVETHKYPISNLTLEAGV